MLARARTAGALATAATVVLLCGGAAYAGDAQSPIPYKPQISDPTGDNAPGDSGSDIVSAGLTTTGTATIVAHTTYTYKIVKKKTTKTVNGKKQTVVVKKKVKVAHTTRSVSYVPDTLVAKVTMAGRPDTSDGSYVEFDFSVPGCGTTYISYAPAAAFSPSQAGFANFSSCYSSDPTEQRGTYLFAPSIDGNTITFSVPLAKTSPKVAIGTVFSKLAAFTGPADPVTGTPSPVGYDDASSPTTYTLS
jgi:hypothetical protein